jgi:hypothetical protein
VRRDEEEIHLLIETLDGKYNVIRQPVEKHPDGANLHQEIMAAYLNAFAQPCVLCGDEAYAVGKISLAEQPDIKDSVILYSLCFVCLADPSSKRIAEEKLLTDFMDHMRSGVA